MIRLILIFLLSFSVLSMFSQETHCNCLENLNKTIQKTEENYAGYPAKVNAATTKEYNTLVQSLKQKASKETNPKNCYYLITDYVTFFKDKHFILSYNAAKDFDSIVVPYSEKYWEKGYSNKTLTPVEGIWTNPDSSIKIGIQKTKSGLYQGVKIESKIDNFPQGFVYFTLIPKGKQYIVKEYNAFLSTSSPAKQTGNLLQLWNRAIWGKMYPQKMTQAERIELATWKNNNNGLAFRKINSQVAYLKIPTFYNNDNNIQRLVTSSDSAIRNTKYLIVDLTGNGGGNTGWIFFLPYFMTNPIIQVPTYLRVTPDNVKLKLADLEPFVKNPISDEYKKYFPDNVLNAYKKAYEELPTTTEKFYPIPSVTFPLDSITKFPEKIALVVDNFCGSSTEYFFYLSKQSKKTTTYGVNTTGMMDYEGMSTSTPLPYHNFILTIPIVKSGWTDKKPIDQTGFKPDVIINLSQNKWIDFIINDLQKR